MKPYFSVGEIVEVRGTFTNEYDTDETEIIESMYFEEGWAEGQQDSPAGWRYKTAHQPDMSMWWRECSLRKKYDKGEDFESLMESLKSPYKVAV